MKFKYVLTTVALTLILVSCKKEETVGEPAKPAFDLAGAKTTVEAGYTEWEKAFNTKDSVGLANCYATDGNLMAPNDKAVEGRAGIQTLFGNWMKQGETPTIDLTLVNLWGDENNLTAENSWVMKDKTGKVVDEGKALEVYKMEDGKWKIFRDCYNSNLPVQK